MRNSKDIISLHYIIAKRIVRHNTSENIELSPGSILIFPSKQVIYFLNMMKKHDEK